MHACACVRVCVYVAVCACVSTHEHAYWLVGGQPVCVRKGQIPTTRRVLAGPRQGAVVRQRGQGGQDKGTPGDAAEDDQRPPPQFIRLVGDAAGTRSI